METLDGTQRVYVEENENIVACITAMAVGKLQGTHMRVELAPLCDPIALATVLFDFGVSLLWQQNVLSDAAKAAVRLHLNVVADQDLLHIPEEDDPKIPF